MKKVMIGILILIPIIILVVVALVSAIVSVKAHIAVEDLQLTFKDSERTVYDLQISLEDVENVNIYDYVSVRILPEKATDKTVEWQIVGDVECTDVEYEKTRNAYVAKYKQLVEELENEYPNFSTQARIDAYNTAKGKYYKDSSLIIDEMTEILIGRVRPAAAFVDEHGREVTSNTSGKMTISDYCQFTVRAQAEAASKILTVTVLGYDVERVELNVSEEESTTMSVGESMRLLPSYTPIQSIVNKTRWEVKSGSDVVKVDQNGVLTALKEGNATVSLFASVYSTEGKEKIKYVEGAIDITVESKGASSLFGEKIVLAASRVFTCEQIGVVKDEIASVEGATIQDDGRIVLSANTALLTTSDGRQLTIESCSDGDIAILNARFYNKESGYVLAVGENVLDLDLTWADMLKTDEFVNVQWTSSDVNVAQVDENGEVKGISSGIATITATVNGKSVSITLNVQKKLSMIQLRTSDASLAIGIARETVFASEKYIDVKASNAKTANSTLIVVQGQPENATAAELENFYSNYNFEIVEGGEYASFDTVVRNRVVFNNTMEGLGKKQVVVKVSAKYPKYEGMTRFITKNVTLNVVYGVAASNIDELYQATLDQEVYAKAEDNIVNPDGIEIFRHETDDAVYLVKGAPYSKRLYAICLEDDCSFADWLEYETDDDGNKVVKANINYDMCAKFYGDVYGNNHIVSAVTGQLNNYLTRAKWNGITVSNIVLRANEIEGDADSVDAKGAAAFQGYLCDIDTDAEYYHASNEHGGGVTFEYSIFENAEQGMNPYNVDVNYVGCIIRNIGLTGMYTPARMNETDEIDEKTGKKIIKPYYSHIDMHNMICSNTLGTVMSITHEHFTIKSNADFRFANGNLNKDKSGELAKANDKYFVENFYNKGICTAVNQTGFFRVYNWQNVDNSNLIKTGFDNLDDILATSVGTLIKENSAFNDAKYIKDDVTYLHAAFICTGIFSSDGNTVMNAPTYLKLNLEDNRFYKFDSKELKSEGSAFAKMVAGVLKNASVTIYGYTNKADIVPGSRYEVNPALIEEIHS